MGRHTYMTPSGAHDDRGSPAHDEMQLDVFRAIKGGRMATIESVEGDARREWSLIKIEAEMALRVGGTTAFADIAATFKVSEYREAIILYEIKPKIVSVGGLIRQCAMLRMAAESVFNTGITMPIVAAVVPRDDPMLRALVEMGGRFVICN